MYFGNSASASRRYAAIDTGSKVEGANPHQLVKILFDELLLAIDSSIVADKAGDRSKCSEKQARALSILHALESSLDFDKGGQVALGLRSEEHTSELQSLMRTSYAVFCLKN